MKGGTQIQQQRQSKNSSALGIIGGSIVTGNPAEQPNQASNPFNRGVMYNTMYGGVGNQSAQSQQNPGVPIHIKIED
jgi:hypothetical protein